MKIIDLSLPISARGNIGMPVTMEYHDHSTMAKKIGNEAGIDPEMVEEVAFAFEEFSYVNTHTATHMDAPWHSGKSSEGKPAKTIDEIPLEWCFGEGVWVDFSHKKPGENITKEDLEKSLHDIGYSLKPGTIVLIRTGTSNFYGKPGCAQKNAGITREATLWLGDQGIKVVGIDSGCWDRPPSFMDEDLKKGNIHQYMQGHRAAGEKGMCILEWLTNLDRLPHFGFIIYAFPVKIEEGSAGWVRVVAFVED